MIDANDRVIGFYDGGLAGAESRDTAARFAALILSRHLCTDLFGVLRADALRKTQMHGSYFGADRALLVELGLLGRFVHVPAPLFMNRDHASRGSHAMGRWRGPHGLPSLVLLSDYRRAVMSHVSDPETRRLCQLHLLRWWACDWNLARVIAEMMIRVHPPFENVVNRLKLHFYGAMPQIRRLPPTTGDSISTFPPTKRMGVTGSKSAD
jgi:hypothetical protein